MSVSAADSLNASNKPTYQGLVMVKQGSRLTGSAKQVADHKGWLLLEVNGQPPEIRQSIQQKFQENQSLQYLLIIGGEEGIPMKSELERDGDFFIVRRMLIVPLWNKEQEEPPSLVDLHPPLDQAFYGNVDDDPEAELMVGRLPFSEPEQVEFYFDNLPSVVNLQDQQLSHFYLPCDELEDFSLGNIFPAMKIKEIFPDSAAAIQKGFSEGAFVYIYLDGLPDGFSYPCQSPKKRQSIFRANELPNLLINHPLIFDHACHNAEIFGKEALLCGATGFWGYFGKAQTSWWKTIRRKPTPCAAFNYFFPSWSGEKTAGHFLRDYFNDYYVKFWFQPNLVIPDCSFVDLTFPVFYGDPSLKINFGEKKLEK